MQTCTLQTEECLRRLERANAQLEEAKKAVNERYGNDHNRDDRLWAARTKAFTKVEKAEKAWSHLSNAWHPKYSEML
jgi:ribosomal protein L11 methylase PrmA